MSFLVLCTIVIVAALFYLVATPQTTSVSAKWAELARLVFAAAVFALLLSIALGTHDAILRVVK